MTRPPTEPRDDQAFSRRRVMIGAALAACAPVLAPASALAGKSRSPVVVVFCDPTLHAAFASLDPMFHAETGTHLSIISAPARIMQAQLARSERDDVLVTLADVAGACADAGLVKLHPELGVFHTSIVVAAKSADTADAFGHGGGAASHAIAGPDPTGNAIFDTESVLTAMGAGADRASHFVGEIDTLGVSDLLAHGRVPYGLVLDTDAHRFRLSVATRLADTVHPPIAFVVAVNKSAQSRNTPRLLELMGSDRGRSALASSGLGWSA